jgi:hypothetical protein
MKLKGITYDVGRDQVSAFGKESIALLRHYQLPQVQGRGRRVVLYLLG